MNKRGISLIEIVVTISIVFLLTSLIIFSFSDQTRERSISGEGLSSLAILDQARSLAMTSKENVDFGVHFTTTIKTLFEGSTYSSSDPDNIDEDSASGTQFVNISLNGGGSDIVFDRLTGRTNDYGTIVIQSTADNNASSTITIYQTGLIEIE
jgi:type II secretory pathway pseudopilin PulG